MGRGAKPKQYPEKLVEQVRELYESGHTQSEIGEITETTQKVIYNLMRRHGIKARVAKKRNQYGDKNTTWKGNEASYTALHLRVEQHRGKPHHCEVCGYTDENARFEWANLTGNYADIMDYQRMCVSCHRNYDANRRKLTGKYTSPRHKGKEVSNA